MLPTRAYDGRGQPFGSVLGVDVAADGTRRGFLVLLDGEAQCPRRLVAVPVGEATVITGEKVGAPGEVLLLRRPRVEIAPQG